ncbi:hypothetical protein VQ056_06445 [Paenibacillus sp. JTLBN-2024]
MDAVDLWRQLANEAVHKDKRYFIRSRVYPEVSIEEGISVRTDAKWMQFILEPSCTEQRH